MYSTGITLLVLLAAAAAGTTLAMAAGELKVCRTDGECISTGGVVLTRDKKAATEPEANETPALSSEQCPPQVQNIYFQAGDAATGGRGEKGDTGLQGPPGMHLCDKI